jgi:P27 family predicted phage terminase small subunit
MSNAPRGLRAAGKRLWRAVTGEFELSEYEAGLLLQMCRTVDTLDDLQAILDENGLISQSSQGERVHPALVEARQQRLVLAKLLAALGLPSGLVDDADGRAQAPADPAARRIFAVPQA